MDERLVEVHEAAGRFAAGERQGGVVDGVAGGAMDGAAPGRRAVRVVMLREGLAKSGRTFTRRALADVARQAEGLRCFADHATADEDRQRPVRSVRDLVGVFRDARVVEPPAGTAGAAGRDGEVVGTPRAHVEATLHVLESAGWLWPLIEASAGGRDAAAGQPEDDLAGLSIDALCVVRQAPVSGTLGGPATDAAWRPSGAGAGTPSVGQVRQAQQVVEAVPALKSCDIVTRASAGGRFLGPVARLTAAETLAETPPEVVASTDNTDAPTGGEGNHRNEGRTLMTGMIETTGATTPASEPLVAVREDGSAVETAGTRPIAPAAVAPDVAPAATEGDTAAGDLAAVREAQVRLECAYLLRERLADATLPDPVKQKLQRTWDPFGSAAVARPWSSGEAYVRAFEAAMDAELEMLAALRGASNPASLAAATGTPETGASLVQGLGAARVDVGMDGAARGRAAVQVALDRLFGVRESEGDGDLALLRRAGVPAPRWTSLREAYTQITGDAAVVGIPQPALSIVREANEVTTAVLNYALLNSMSKRLLQDYAGQPQDWRKFCSVRAIKDFKSQDRIRLYDFGSLSTVAEGAAYTNLAWDDSKESYSPAKKGNLVVVTREAILNDDLDSVRRIPTKLAIAAGITINEFVYGLFTSNPFMADGDKVFDDGVQTTHANYGTTALSSAALQAAITKMLKQTNSAGKRLNLRPRYLLVPPDLIFTALTLVNSTLVPGSNNNDANVLKGAVEPISVAQFTDATDWYLIADPAQVESIEIGFVGGREAPDILLQDAPAAGAVFTNDQMSFRVRWEFGGGWLDYRGAFWSQVAG